MHQLTRWTLDVQGLVRVLASFFFFEKEILLSLCLSLAMSKTNIDVLIRKIWDQCHFLSNCTPAPPLTRFCYQFTYVGFGDGLVRRRSDTDIDQKYVGRG